MKISRREVTTPTPTQGETKPQNSKYHELCHKITAVAACCARVAAACMHRIGAAVSNAQNSTNSTGSQRVGIINTVESQDLVHDKEMEQISQLGKIDKELQEMDDGLDSLEAYTLINAAYDLFESPYGEQRIDTIISGLQDALKAKKSGNSVESKRCITELKEEVKSREEATIIQDYFKAPPTNEPDIAQIDIDKATEDPEKFIKHHWAKKPGKQSDFVIYITTFDEINTKKGDSYLKKLIKNLNDVPRRLREATSHDIKILEGILKNERISKLHKNGENRKVFKAAKKTLENVKKHNNPEFQAELRNQADTQMLLDEERQKQLALHMAESGNSAMAATNRLAQQSIVCNNIAGQGAMGGN